MILEQWKSDVSKITHRGADLSFQRRRASSFLQKFPTINNNRRRKRKITYSKAFHCIFGIMDRTTCVKSLYDASPSITFNVATILCMHPISADEYIAIHGGIAGKAILISMKEAALGSAIHLVY
jgi:hypothetical protein